MDMEKIQKINALALDLMNKGLAQDREDATRQAERIFYKKGSEEYSDIRGRMEEVKSDSAKSKVEEDIHSEKIKEILEKNTQFLVNKIREFQEKVTLLENEISALKNKMTTLTLSPRPAEKSAPSGLSVPPQGKENPPSSSHPRVGNYQEQDVSIEKFFYMGKK